jgi:hypothetical protein
MTDALVDVDGLVIVEDDEVQRVHTDDGTKDAEALAAYLERWDFGDEVISELSHVEFMEEQND